MQYADLHIHSYYSDGNVSPEGILEIAKNNNIKCISITDHDNISAQKKLQSSYNSTDIEIISGVELSTEYENYEVHILGYFIDINNLLLNKLLDHIKEVRMNRILEILLKLQKMGVDINVNDLEMNNNFQSIGRAHIAKILVDKGYASSFKGAFHNYLAKDKSAYVDRFKVSYKDVLKIIKDCGGISVLAHPGKTYKGIFIEKLIKDLKVYGLMGIEVFHPSHNINQVSQFYNLAKKYNLAITGGSDFHCLNSNNNINIGSCGLSQDLLNKFIKYNKLGEIK